jgi:hypothetical protein
MMVGLLKKSNQEMWFGLPPAKNTGTVLHAEQKCANFAQSVNSMCEN